MTQDNKDDKKVGKDDKTRKRSDTSSNVKDTKNDTDCLPTKIVIRRLPPSWNADVFLEQVAPVPDNDYFYFVPADMSLGQNAFSRAYLNLTNRQDIAIFMEKFDGYVFVDSKGLEYPAVVEFAPFSKVPKRRPKKCDPRKGTIEADVDYLKFLHNLQNAEHEAIPTPDTFLEEIETREKQLKENVLVSTPLIEFMIKRREEKKLAIVQAQQAREDKRRKELERRKREEEMRIQERERLKEKEKQRQREKEERAKRKEDQARNTTAVPTPTPVKLLKNPEREKEHEQQKDKPDVAKATEAGRSKQPESGRKATREYESDRRDRNVQRETTSRQSLDSRSSSQRYSKATEEGDEKSYRQGRHVTGPALSSTGRPRQDRSHKEKDADDYQPKQVVVEKRPEKFKEQTEPLSDKKGESEKPITDEKDSEHKEKKTESDVKPKGSQLRDEKRQKPDESRGGAREYRDGRYPKDRRDPRYPNDTKEYRDRDRRSERDDRDYRDRERRDYRDRDYRDDKDVKYKGELKTSGQRESGGDHGNRGSTRRDDSMTEKSKNLDDRHGDRKPGAGGSGVRRNSTELAGSETGSQSSKEKTPDHESSPVVLHSGRDMADRRSSEKDSHRSSGDVSSRQRIRYKDRPERAIYNPGKRAVERKKDEVPARADEGEQDK